MVKKQSKYKYADRETIFKRNELRRNLEKGFIFNPVGVDFGETIYSNGFKSSMIISGAPPAERRALNG
jgi:hypothetical protein